MTRLNSVLKDNVTAWVLITVFVVLTISSTITMRRSFYSAQREDTTALISYVRCLLLIDRDVPDRIGALDACAEAAIKRGDK